MLKIFQEYVWSSTTCSKTLLKLEIIEKWNKIMFFSFTKIVKVVIDCICIFYIIFFYLSIIVLIIIINYYYLLLKINKKRKENNTDVLSIVNNLTNCGVLSERILPDLVRGTLTVWHWQPTINLTYIPYVFTVQRARLRVIAALITYLTNYPASFEERLIPIFKRVLLCVRHF